MSRLCDSTALQRRRGMHPLRSTWAQLIEYGQGVAQDRAEAIRWYRLAAAQGHADAQISLRRLSD